MYGHGPCPKTRTKTAHTAGLEVSGYNNNVQIKCRTAHITSRIVMPPVTHSIQQCGAAPVVSHMGPLIISPNGSLDKVLVTVSYRHILELWAS